jgi:hypothetical protein
VIFDIVYLFGDQVDGFPPILCVVGDQVDGFPPIMRVGDQVDGLPPIMRVGDQVDGLPPILLFFVNKRNINNKNIKKTIIKRISLILYNSLYKLFINQLFIW